MKMKTRNYFPLCVIVVTLLIGVTSKSVAHFEDALRRSFRTYFQNGDLGRILNSVIKELELTQLSKTPEEEVWTTPKISLFCTTCAAGVNELLSLNDTESIAERAIQLCVDLEFGSQYVCENLINNNQDDLFYIIANTPAATGNDVCGVVFVGRGCTTRNPDRVWEVGLPDVPKPPVDETPYPEPGAVPTAKILHLADTHFDPAYSPGSSVDCEEIYLCCRAESTPKDGSRRAGLWGSYGACDIPRWTLQSIYAHIADTHPDIDFIIWTGDIVPHAAWNTSRSGNLEVIRQMADLISFYFPGVTVFPAVGNHESDPLNLFPQPYVTDPEFDISWLYDELTDIWGRWLPAEAASSIAYSAYYAVQIKEGLRLVSINTNYCYAFNWWLIHDSTDISEELHFLASELQDAEDKGEFVYIIGHIPSGHRDCMFTWSHEFNRVVARYESSISGIFYGHTHKDHFQIFFDPDDLNSPMQVGHVGQSQTTYTDLNPGYKIYTVEGNFEGTRYRPLNYESYILDLTAANALNETNFFKLYDALEEYELEDFSPQSFLNLVMKMNSPNSTLFNSYYRNYYKAGTPYMTKECDEACKEELLCRPLVSDNSDRSKCDLL